MTKIAFVGDVHVANHKKFGGPIVGGINSRCEGVLYALASSVTKARSEGAEALVILGDLFDTPRPLPQMIRRVQEIVEQIPTIILAGNHDQCSDSPGDNALAPLYPVAEVIDEPDIVPIGDLDLIVVPYLSGDYTRRLACAVDEQISPDAAKEKKKQILCFHAGIVDDRTPKFLSESSASITKRDLTELCSKYALLGAFAGHWHTRREWMEDPFIIQAGALAPTGFGDQGTDYGNLFVYDTNEMSYTIHFVPGPRFLDVTLDQDITTIGAGKNISLGGCKLYIRINVEENEIRIGEAIIKAGIDSGIIENGELSINLEKTRQACEKAAQTTRSSENLEDALSAYTANMPVKGVDDIDIPEARLEILTKALEYLRKNGAD